MSKKEKIKVDNTPVCNFKELLERYKNFKDNVAFKYKKNGEIIDITYQKYVEDIEALRNSYFKLRD